MRDTGEILLGNRIPIAFSEQDIALHPETVLEFHPNGMTLTAFDEGGDMLHSETYFRSAVDSLSPEQSGSISARRGCGSRDVVRIGG